MGCHPASIGSVAMSPSEADNLSHEGREFSDGDVLRRCRR